MMAGAGEDSLIADFLNFEDSCESDACLNFRSENRCGLGATSSFEAASGSPVDCPGGTNLDRAAGVLALL